MFKNIKEFLKDPKKKSLTQLGLYFIFFLIIFIFIATADKIDYEEEVPEEEGIINYNFIVTITNNEEINTITGSFKDNEYTYNYNEFSYVYKDGVTYLDNAIVDPIYNIEDYNYMSIENLIKYSESETTYKDNSNKTTYNINLNKYVLEKNIGVFGLADGNLSLTLEKDKYINKVEITRDTLNIKIEYSNINKL